MRTYHRPFLVSFVAALVLSLVSTAVAGAPTDALKQTVDQVVKLLSDPALAERLAAWRARQTQAVLDDPSNAEEGAGGG